MDAVARFIDPANLNKFYKSPMNAIINHLGIQKRSILIDFFASTNTKSQKTVEGDAALSAIITGDILMGSLMSMSYMRYEAINIFENFIFHLSENIDAEDISNLILEDFNEVRINIFNLESYLQKCNMVVTASDTLMFIQPTISAKALKDVFNLLDGINKAFAKLMMPVWIIASSTSREDWIHKIKKMYLMNMNRVDHLLMNIAESQTIKTICVNVGPPTILTRFQDMLLNMPEYISMYSRQEDITWNAINRFVSIPHFM